MVTYPGLPAPKIRDWLSRDKSTARYAPGTTFQMGMIELLANTGTYIDAPWHRYEQGNDVAGYALEAVADLPSVLVTATAPGRAIQAGAFAGIGAPGEAGLGRTGLGPHPRTPQDR